MNVISNPHKKATRAKVVDIIKNMSVMFKPRDPRSVTEIVGDIFKLPEGGSFDIDLVPYMREPLDFLKDRDTHMIVYVSPARAGKTITIVVGGIVYVVSEDPSDCLIVHITDKTATKFSKLTIARAFYNSPFIRKLLPSNKDNNNVLSKFLRNGMALMIGYPAPSQLAATDYKYVFITDSDRSPDDNGQGDWIKQADKRTQTFGSSGKTVLESSPSRDIIDPDWKKKTRHEAPPVAGIMSWYNMGDRRIEYWDCPECGEPIALHPNYDLFKLPPRDDLIKELSEIGTTAAITKYNRIWCPNHGCEILPDEKQEMGANLHWEREDPDAPNNPIKSYWGNGYSAGFQTWYSLLSEYFLALLYWSETGDESKLRTTYNVDMGTPYQPLAMEDQMSASELRKRAYDFGEFVVPDGVRYLIANIDTQKWKWVVDVQGVGKGNQRWIIDRFDIKVSAREIEDGGREFVQPATYVEDWDMITEKVLMKTYPLGDGSGRVMKIHHTVCDMQGADGVTENAYKYARKLKYELGIGKLFTLLRGERPNPRTNQPLTTVTKLDKTSSSAVNARVVGKLSFVRVNTTVGKDVVAGQLRRTKRGANYINFSVYLPDEVFDECTVEVRTSAGWDNPLNKRNEQFDLLNYGGVNINLIEMTLPQKQLDWEHPPNFADVWDKNVNVLAREGSDASNKNAQIQSDHDKLMKSRSKKR